MTRRQILRKRRKMQVNDLISKKASCSEQQTTTTRNAQSTCPQSDSSCRSTIDSDQAKQLTANGVNKVRVEQSKSVETSAKSLHNEPQEMLLELLELGDEIVDDTLRTNETFIGEKPQKDSPSVSDEEMTKSKPKRVTAECHYIANNNKIAKKDAISVATVEKRSEEAKKTATGKKAKSVQNDFGVWKSFHDSVIISNEILDDLVCRFIINCPNIYNDLIRLCFEIELAHWFYKDFYCSSQAKKLDKAQAKLAKSCNIRHFAMAIFEHVPQLHRYLPKFNQIFDEWLQYKKTVPTFGAILITEDLQSCLLVQSYLSNGSWSFPKGKVNESETPMNCAVREVFEETGYDIKEMIKANEYIDAVVKKQYLRLYIVWNVPRNTVFQPRTRQEIKKIDWFLIDGLPEVPKDAETKQRIGTRASALFLVLPFVKNLKKIVHQRRAEVGKDYLKHFREKNKKEAMQKTSAPDTHALSEQNAAEKAFLSLKTCLFFNTQIRVLKTNRISPAVTLPCKKTASSSGGEVNGLTTLPNPSLQSDNLMLNEINSKTIFNNTSCNETSSSGYTGLNFTDDSHETKNCNSLSSVTLQPSSETITPDTLRCFKPITTKIALEGNRKNNALTSWDNFLSDISISPISCGDMQCDFVAETNALTQLECECDSMMKTSTPNSLACLDVAPRKSAHAWKNFCFDMNSILADLTYNFN